MKNPAEIISEMQQKSLKLDISFRGEIIDPQLVAGSQPPAPELCSSPSSDPIDLVSMANWALHGLRAIPDPERAYRPRFTCFLLGNPVWGGPSCWDIGDVGARMSRAFVLLREILGEKQRDPIEESVNDWLFSRLREDGLIWLPPGDILLKDREGVSGWTNGLMAAACAEQYRLTSDLQWKKLAKKLFEGWRKHLVAWKDGRAYHPWLSSDLKGGNFDHPVGYDNSASYAVRYWEATGDEEALHLSVGLAEGVLAGTELAESALPGETAALIRGDGSYSGHVHAKTRNAALGVLMTGLATGNHRYVEWAKRVYDFTKTLGTDTGWFPEYTLDGMIWSEYRDRGETCITSDMASLAAYLGRAGYTECYDDLERYLRNYLRWTQFFLTPKFEAAYRQRNGEGAETGLAELRRLEGTWVASPRPNDLRFLAQNQTDNMGCCMAEGNLALWEAWANTVTKERQAILVNMSFNRETPQVKVVSCLPNLGCLQVVAKIAVRQLRVRPPSWTPRGEVRSYRNRQPAPVNWNGDYVCFEGVKAAEELTVTYPLLSFRQKLWANGQMFLQQWLGNTIMDVEPRSEEFPIFTGSGPKLPPLPAAGGGRT